MKDKKTVLELGRGVSIADASIRPDTTQNYVINAFFSQAMSQPNIGIISQQQKTYNN